MPVSQCQERDLSLSLCFHLYDRIAVLNSSTSEHQPAGVPFLSQLFAIVSSVRMGGVSKALMGLAAVAVGMALLCNLPDNPFVPAPKPASLDYLAETTLSTMDKKPRKFKVRLLLVALCACVYASVHACALFVSRVFVKKLVWQLNKWLYLT